MDFKRISRRSLLLSAGFLGGLWLSPPQSSSTVAQTQSIDNPFNLGVASGEPDPNSVVIWTKLNPQSLPLRGKIANLPIQWRVTTDEKLTQIIAEGTTLAVSDLDYAVHVVVNGLEPNQWYWYQFQTGTEVSPIGRTRTAPIGTTEQLSFAFVSCQNYEHGYFNAYRHLAREELDFIIHLGDYIYESSGRANSDFPRNHNSPEPTDLEGYRQRYRLYKSDPDLQEAHRLFPFICTWDDHEVENDYANLESENFESIESFKQRRIAAYQAYYEHLPLRPSAKPQGEKIQLYRRFQWGDLATLHILDERQYRDDQACDQNGKGGGQIIVNCQERLEEQRSLLGHAQEQWLFKGLENSTTQWNIIAQPYLVAELKRTQKNQQAFWSDAWDGYAASRQRLLNFIAQKSPPNPIFIGGDIHSFWVTELKLDFQDLSSPNVACEFVGTSISSNGLPYEQVAPVLAENPHIQFFESRLRGYVKCTVSDHLWRSDLQVVNTVREKNSTLTTLASFGVESGKPKIQKI